MGADGKNCGALRPAKKKLDDHTCICGNGYMNREGTLIDGDAIRAGHALSRKDYAEHRDCKRCARDPTKCPSRQDRLQTYPPESIITRPESGMFEMFLPGNGVSPKILEAFLRENHDDLEWDYEYGKTFKVVHI